MIFAQVSVHVKLISSPYMYLKCYVLLTVLLIYLHCFSGTKSSDISILSSVYSLIHGATMIYKARLYPYYGQTGGFFPCYPTQSPSSYLNPPSFCSKLSNSKALAFARPARDHVRLLLSSCTPLALRWDGDFGSRLLQ